MPPIRGNQTPTRRSAWTSSGASPGSAGAASVASCGASGTPGLSAAGGGRTSRAARMQGPVMMDPIGEKPAGMSGENGPGGAVVLAGGVWVDPGDLLYAFARSGGPGGQAVNKEIGRASCREGGREGDGV